MEKVTIQAGDMAGFAGHSGNIGEPVEVIRSARLTSDDPRFFLYVNQIEQEFLGPARIFGGALGFLVVLHPDNVADIYTGYQPVVTGTATRDISAGDPVNVEDVRDISRYEIPDVEIVVGDRVVCVVQSGWKFGLYFDFSRDLTGAEEVWEALGSLADALHVARTVKNLQLQLLQDEQPHIMTEGKTDLQHIEAARCRLAPDLLLGYFEPGEKFGHSKLLDVCEHQARFGPPNTNKVIAIFDRDNAEMLSKLQRIGPLDEFQSWGNNVYSMVLPIPSHRGRGQGLSIESLYTDADLIIETEDGKRMYFWDELERNELSPGLPLWSVVSPVGAPPTNRKLFTGPAARVVNANGDPVAISKALFAKFVLEGRGAFADVDFSGFEGVFRTIRNILRDGTPTVS
ncbi:hypothetical protein [Phytohabitans suffuscus]|uniref:Uncharacterized protein n=1 Tax=Phytohabitans suffuscus TaxID=624315 RepID=A0A6F8YEE6_9ACTN|nr:hypothetical protein [Phytohabitans suffuscus]BCB84437.1 hypothetical protein Psuf_017500 [Phytohabitans suffuscus]